LKRTFRVFFFIFFLPYLCLHNLSLVRVEVVWVWFDVLSFISEFHFHMCCWCFPLRCLFQCLFVCLFAKMFFYFVFIPSLYLLIVYVMWLYFINYSLKVYEYVALKWDYHILFVYWLIVYVVFLKIYRNIVCIIQWNYN
jgi:hypothetical protein